MIKPGRMIGRAILLAATLAAPASAEEPRAALGAYTLGMSIEDARLVPSKGTTDAEFRLLCSDDIDELARPFVGSAEAAEGVVVCKPTFHIFLPTSGTDIGWRDGVIMFGDIGLEPRFRFLNGRLIEMAIASTLPLSQRLGDALNIKYGAPHTVQTGRLSNAYGAEWATETRAWQVGPDTITLTAPATTRSDMLVTYSNPLAVSQLEARLRARAAQSTAAGI